MSEPEIFVLDDREETLGPFEPFDVDAMIEEGKIQPGAYAFCAGMPDWRSVAEALVWARRTLAKTVEPAFKEICESLFLGRINDASARQALKEALFRVGTVTSESEMCSLMFLISANVGLAQGRRQWEESVNRDVIDVWPAAELFGIQTPLNFPRDWAAAWIKAGGRLRAGRMIALKDDPVWARLSDFGLPFPPFGMESGMWTRDIEMHVAVELEICESTDEVSPNMNLREFRSVLD
jgi:hypothetical protein